MKRFVSILALFLVAVLLVSSLAGCQKSREKMLIGRWVNKYDPSLFSVFAADGSGYYNFVDGGEFSWKLEGNTLILQLRDGVGVVEVAIKKLTEKELILEDSYSGITLEFVKD